MSSMSSPWTASCRPFRRRSAVFASRPGFWCDAARQNEEGAAMVETLSDVLEDTGTFEKVATGFVFTEGPLWHPDGFFYFVDVRASGLFKITLGQPPEKIRETQGGNGLTFDLKGRLINCEGDGRRVTRTGL